MPRRPCSITNACPCAWLSTTASIELAITSAIEQASCLGWLGKFDRYRDPELPDGPLEYLDPLAQRLEFGARIGIGAGRLGGSDGTHRTHRTYGAGRTGRPSWSHRSHRSCWSHCILGGDRAPLSTGFNRTRRAYGARGWLAPRPRHRTPPPPAPPPPHLP